MSGAETNMIVPHLEQLVQQSLQYKITLLFVEKILSPKGNFVFTSVNLFQYLKGFRYTAKDLKRNFDGHLKDTSNTFLLYPSGYAAVIIITIPEDERESIITLKLRADANVKAYQMLHQEMLTKESHKLIIINVIGAIHQKKLPSSCDQCSKNNLIIYKEDFEIDLKSWWKRCFRMMRELTKNYRIEYDIHYIEELASRLYLGITDAAQREIMLFNSDPRKIITGKNDLQNFQ